MGSGAGFGRSAAVDITSDVDQDRFVYRFAKRTLDITLSCLAILVGLVPAILLCSVIILMSPGASPIYSQTRIGKDGVPFSMYKFRSMVPNADKMLEDLRVMNEADGPLFKIRDDPRVIPGIGSFIRRHSIDELPQILNVLLGNMSLVGPRPALPCEYEHYTDRDRLRLLVKPGCSGYWQVSGRSNTTFDQMIDLDIAYIRDSSMMVDLKIIAKTFGVMFWGEGAY